ncbi:MAG: xanthine dehydrogenase family protein subunit M [Pseudomonadota bacterium]
MYALSYKRPETISEAVDLLTADPDAKLLAGGMTLIPSLKQRLMRVTSLIDLSGVTGMAEISVKDGVLRIGALTTHHAVARSKAVHEAIPALASLAGKIGDSQVRNRGTIGGSVANNDPAADYPAALLALDACIVTDRRRIAAADFIQPLFSTNLDDNEIVTAIEFQIPSVSGYAKLPNPASRYAIVGIFFARFDDGCRVGVTGATSCAFRWRDAEARLAVELSVSSVEGLILKAEDLNSDLHANAVYRTHVAGAMLEDAITQALET